MKKLALLPSILTLANGACGFAALVNIAAYSNSQQESYLVLAAWLILLAMLFDGLDGGVARLANVTTEFGIQFDSLCDLVSFGVAPALLVTVWNSKFFEETFWAKMTWFFCLAYVLAAALRLARFNIDAHSESSAHREFKGLSSPGAAGMVVSLVIVHNYLITNSSDVLTAISQLVGRQHLVAMAALIKTGIPFIMMLLAFLMVSSRFRYVHLTNRVLKRYGTFDFFTYMLFIAVLVALVKEFVIMTAFFIYCVSGPIAYLIGILRPHLGREIEKEHAEEESPQTLIGRNERLPR